MLSCTENNVHLCSMCPFEHELQNKTFYKSSVSYSCKESTHCILKGMCSTRSRTGVAKHTAGVKEVQGGEWMKLDLSSSPWTHLDSPLKTFSGGCDQSLLLASVSALSFSPSLSVLLLSLRLISVCRFLFLSFLFTCISSFFFLSYFFLCCFCG